MEPTRTRSRSAGSVFHLTGRNDVGVYCSESAGIVETRVAPAIPMERLLEGVTLSDGRRPLDAGATVRARCESIPWRTGDPPDAWRRVPVRVEVEAPGHLPIEYDFLLDAPVLPRILTRDE